MLTIFLILCGPFPSGKSPMPRLFFSTLLPTFAHNFPVLSLPCKLTTGPSLSTLRSLHSSPLMAFTSDFHALTRPPKTARPNVPSALSTTSLALYYSNPPCRLPTGPRLLPRPHISSTYDPLNPLALPLPMFVSTTQHQIMPLSVFLAASATPTNLLRPSINSPLGLPLVSS